MGLTASVYPFRVFSRPTHRGHGFIHPFTSNLLLPSRDAPSCFFGLIRSWISDPINCLLILGLIPTWISMTRSNYLLILQLDSRRQEPYLGSLIDCRLLLLPVWTLDSMGAARRRCQTSSSPEFRDSEDPIRFPTRTAGSSRHQTCTHLHRGYAFDGPELNDDTG